MKRQKRILIFPNTNTLSHVSRALALCAWLTERGYSVHLGVSIKRLAWVARHWSNCYGIRELWETSGKPFPVLQWFSDKDLCEACVRSQEELIKKIRPDLIVGIFDFVASMSRNRIPYLTINGACMLPWYDGVLGFDETESAHRDEQKDIFSAFWTFACRSFEGSLRSRGLPAVRSALDLLCGDINCMYEVFSVALLSNLPQSCRYIGPIFWDGWDSVGEAVPWTFSEKRKTVYCNAGTLMKNERTMAAIMDECLNRGFRLMMSSGDSGPAWSTDRVFCRPFLRPGSALSLADISICTGGVGACYMNLAKAIPSLVIPMQPEQATNGINVARLGCGEMYRKNKIFLGDSQQYHEPFLRDRFNETLDTMIASLPSYRAPLHRMCEELSAVDAKSAIFEIVKDMA